MELALPIVVVVLLIFMHLSERRVKKWVISVEAEIDYIYKKIKTIEEALEGEEENEEEQGD